MDKIYAKIGKLEWIKKDEQDETCMVQGKNPTKFNLKKDIMAADQIFAHASAKTDIGLDHIRKYVK